MLHPWWPRDGRCLIDSYEVGMQTGPEVSPGVPAALRLRPPRYMRHDRTAGGERRGVRTFSMGRSPRAADLMADNYYGRFAELCRQNGLKSSPNHIAAVLSMRCRSARVSISHGRILAGRRHSRSVNWRHPWDTCMESRGWRRILHRQPGILEMAGTSVRMKAQGDWMYAQGLNSSSFTVMPAAAPRRVPGMTWAVTASISTARYVVRSAVSGSLSVALPVPAPAGPVCRRSRLLRRRERARGGADPRRARTGSAAGMIGTPSMRGHPHPRAHRPRPHCLAGWDELPHVGAARRYRVSLNLMRKIRNWCGKACVWWAPGRKALPACRLSRER